MKNCINIYWPSFRWNERTRERHPLEKTLDFDVVAVGGGGGQVEGHGSSSAKIFTCDEQ